MWNVCPIGKIFEFDFIQMCVNQKFSHKMQCFDEA